MRATLQVCLLAAAMAVGYGLGWSQGNAPVHQRPGATDKAPNAKEPDPEIEAAQRLLRERKSMFARSEAKAFFKKHGDAIKGREDAFFGLLKMGMTPNEALNELSLHTIAEHADELNAALKEWANEEAKK